MRGSLSEGSAFLNLVGRYKAHPQCLIYLMRCHEPHPACRLERHGLRVNIHASLHALDLNTALPYYTAMFEFIETPFFTKRLADTSMMTSTAKCRLT